MISFKDIHNNEIEIDNIEKNYPLGRWKAAVVYEATVSIKDKVQSLAYKDHTAYPLRMCSDPEKAFDNYKKLKSLNLKTWKHFYLSEDRKKLLMDNWNTKETIMWTFFNDNSGIFTDFFNKEENKLEKISNLDEIIENITKDLELCTNNNIWIPEDTYFYSIKKNHNWESNIEYIFWDFDNVKQNYDWIDLKEKNIQCFINSFREWLWPCLKWNSLNVYLNKILEKLIINKPS